MSEISAPNAKLNQANSRSLLFSLLRIICGGNEGKKKIALRSLTEKKNYVVINRSLSHTQTLIHSIADTNDIVLME